MATRNLERLAATSAFATLPPQLQAAIASHRVEPARVEECGALCLRIPNQAGLSDKTRALTALRAAANEFGLDLLRLPFAQSLDSRFDDGTLLVCQRDRAGRRPKLFCADGSVHPEAKQAAPDSAPSRPGSPRHR